MSRCQFRYSLDVEQGSPHWLESLATGVLVSWEWYLLQGSFYEIEWVAIVVEEPTKVCQLLVQLYLGGSCPSGEQRRR